MALLLLKAGFALVVLCTGLFGAMLPWRLRAGGGHERLMMWGDTFAAGVLGGAGLLHLLSGGAEAFRGIAPDLGYPLAFLLAGAGFLLILLIEGVIVAGHAAENDGAGGYVGAHHEIGPAFQPGSRQPYAFILLLVLSVHSILVGLALGAQATVLGAAVVLAAILAHKAVAGFALGVGFQRAGMARRQAVGPTVLFAIMTPLGIVSGTAVQALVSSRGGQWFEAVFDSLGAGTFLYIASLDILRTEFEAPGNRWQKWLSVCLGFGAMAVLALWL